MHKKKESEFWRCLIFFIFYFYSFPKNLIKCSTVVKNASGHYCSQETSVSASSSKGDMFLKVILHILDCKAKIAISKRHLDSSQRGTQDTDQMALTGKVGSNDHPDHPNWPHKCCDCQWKSDILPISNERSLLTGHFKCPRLLDPFSVSKADNQHNGQWHLKRRFWLHHRLVVKTDVECTAWSLSRN